jgi:DNA (cytosine-5)-methyltransferase 1
MAIKKNNLNFIDLFSGAGGLSCGLEMTGMNCLLGVDFNKDAIDTFKKNHPSSEVYCGDITKLKSREIKILTKNKKIHLVAGGPPCQGFSTVGKGNPKDQRNQLFKQFIRVVKDFNPEFVVMENVTGLLAKKNEKSLQSIIRLFNKLGYNIDVNILSAHNYGVPEKRRRTIFIGSRINNEISFPQVTHFDAPKLKKHHYVQTVGDALFSLQTKNGLVHNHDVKLAAIKNPIDLKRIKRIPEGKGIRYERDEKAYLTKALSLGINWKETHENRLRQTKYQRLDSTLPSPTIMTHRHNYYHPTEHRFLTQREAASIQSFPNDFVFSGSVTSQWRQIGNAVPPLLGKSIGQAINIMYNKSCSNIQISPVSKFKEEIGKKRGNAFKYVEK